MLERLYTKYLLSKMRKCVKNSHYIIQKNGASIQIMNTMMLIQLCLSIGIINIGSMLIDFIRYFIR